MSPQELWLSMLVLLTLFLSFALVLVAIALANRRVAQELRALLRDIGALVPAWVKAAIRSLL